jgi:5-methylcytosine-specific restriction endonuclease McrA
MGKARATPLVGTCEPPSGKQGGSVPRKKRSPQKVADELFSKVVRLRDQYCQRCGTPNNLQCAHIITRSYPLTRFDEANAMALCAGCHKYFTHRPLEWIDYVGKDRFWELKRKAQEYTAVKTNYPEVIARLKTRLTELGAASTL